MMHAHWKALQAIMCMQSRIAVKTQCCCVLIHFSALLAAMCALTHVHFEHHQALAADSAAALTEMAAKHAEAQAALQQQLQQVQVS
jgi:hypothetical protein